MATQIKGDCYKLAFEVVLEKKDYKLVHGSVFLKDRNMRIDHAWAENGYLVYSGSFYLDCLSKVDFETLFEPIIDHVYTHDDLVALLLSHPRGFNYGPWTDREREEALRVKQVRQKKSPKTGKPWKS